MKYLIYLGLSFTIICTKNFKQIITPTSNAISKSVDTSKYAIMKFDLKSNNYLFGKNSKETDLSSVEIVRIENLISKRTDEYNKEGLDSANAINKRRNKKSHIYGDVWRPSLISNSKNYYKQFVAIINSNGEKEVWVNCFCSIDNLPDWKRRIVMMLDGGSCYFQLKINLSKNTVYDFLVNGVA